MSNIEQLLRAVIPTLSSGYCSMRSSIQLKPYSKVILCIDDDVSVLECEREFLTNFGYTVLTAPSADEELQRASKLASHLLPAIEPTFSIDG